MICSIHQPQTFPWLGYFAKIIESDVFIFLDDVQFKKNEWQNRNRIKTAGGWQWLTVPVIHRFGQLLHEVRINDRDKWAHRHLQSLKTHYAKAPYFPVYFPELEKIYAADWKSLSEFNLRTILWGMEKLDIKTRTLISSQMPQEQAGPAFTADERLIHLTRAVGADCYLSGAGGHNYLHTDLFPASRILLKFQRFEHPAYSQLFGEFVSHLSVLDLLFNEGPHSRPLIERGIQ